MKYKDWLNEWLETFVRPTSKAKTYDRYCEIVRGQLSRIGDYDMDELTPVILQRFVAGLLSCGSVRAGRGLSSNSVNGIVTAIQLSLRAANKAGLVKEYVADQIKRPKIVEKKVFCFTAAEQRQIEQAALAGKKQKMLGVVLCLYTGLRIGELLALTWEDVDFKSRTLTVARTCHDGKDGAGKFMRIVDSPKTETSKRCLPLPERLLPLLARLRAFSPAPYVVSAGGRPLSVRSYQRSFELLLKRLGIRHRGFHALRHTFATRALECGMDVKTLSELLGHKNPTVTLHRYAHSLTQHKRDMINRLARLVFSDRVSQETQ